MYLLPCTDLLVLEESRLVYLLLLVSWANLLVKCRSVRALHVLFRHDPFHISIHVLFQMAWCVAGSSSLTVGAEVAAVEVARTVFAA